MLWWKPVKHRDHLAGEPQINHQWSAPHKEMLWSLEILVGGKIQGREASRFPGNMVKVQASPAFSHKLPFSAPLKSAICKSLNCQLAPPTRCTAVGGGGLTYGGLTRFHGPRHTPHNPVTSHAGSRISQLTSPSPGVQPTLQRPETCQLRSRLDDPPIRSTENLQPCTWYEESNSNYIR